MRRIDLGTPPTGSGYALRIPRIGDVVHFYELRNNQIKGPYAAIITQAESWSGEAHLAVLGESELRFVFCVPFNDGGRETGEWWIWPIDIVPIDRHVH